jgi:hypothetical protein
MQPDASWIMFQFDSKVKPCDPKINHFKVVGQFLAKFFHLFVVVFGDQ